MDLGRRLVFAQALAREAGLLARQMRSGLGAPETKTRMDFCTEADHAVEQLVRTRVTAEFGDAVVGEEHGGDPGASTWFVDPIDGTAGYIHGTPRWCVSLAYVQDGRTELGVTHAPDDGRMFAARRGRGAMLDGRPIRVSGLVHRAAPVIEVGWSGRVPIDAYCAVLQRLTADGMEFRRHGSGALALAEVAAGLADGYLELHMNPWDALAGLLLVAEAGGHVGDYVGAGGLGRGAMALACTPQVAGRLRAAAGCRA